MKQYLEMVARFPKSILFVLTLITGYFVWQIGYLTEDSNPYLIPESHPARSSILEMRNDFTGTYDSVLVAVYNENTIFNKTSLNALYTLTRDARKLSFVDDTDISRLELIKSKYPGNNSLQALLDGILENGLTQSDASPIRKYLSASNFGDLDSTDVKYLRVVAERADPIRELAGMAATENAILEQDGTLKASVTLNTLDLDPKSISTSIMNNELMDMGVVDKEGKVGLVVVEISVLQDDAEGQLRAYEAFTNLVDGYKESHPDFVDETFIGGVPVFFAEQKKIIDSDLGALLPLVILLVGVVLAVFFKTVLGVVIPLVNVIMCTIWTLGMMAVTGVPLDLITATLPVFLITICSSDAIHVMAEYYQNRNSGKNKADSVAISMKSMASPVVLTTLTTCITFTVSTMTSISNLKNFGIFMSVGMFVAMVISLLMIPAWLCLLKDKSLKKVKKEKNAEDYFISKILLKASNPVLNNRPVFISVFVVFMAGAAWVASNVSIDDMGSGYFSKDNSFRVADEFINDSVAGTSPGWIEIDTKKKDGAVSLEVINFVDRLEKFMHEQERVTFSYSIARYVRRINYVLNDYDDAYNRLPEEKERFVDKDLETGETYEQIISGDDIARQAILMFENGGGSDLTNVLNSDFSKTVLLYTMNTTVASEYQALLDSLNKWLAENTPEGISVKLAGSPVIWTAVLDELLSAQKLSLVLAFFCVLITMSVWLRSARLGLAGTLPLLCTVVCFFAAMTLFGIELNIGTAIISFLVLGIVDYSVHYIMRIREGIALRLTLDKAIQYALVRSGRSIIANVIVFTVGFMALLFSSFRPIVDLGALVGLSLFLSGVFSLFTITLFAPWLVPMDAKDTNDVEKQAVSSPQSA